ncbi:hypothetical protein FVEN_g10864 [Fusarium venenatum]|uniref:Uncharacterized protein n=1 Tax=Fusarium venenatum TaxID=56646 RepID=A0A2L2TUU6_9HYPO|nr:uncharacterized protein FVRRES_00567 [Fusarium venenatum]KAG8351031.1 hypothetical protein FVEN_g10864 [Fusarium venenatum]KAH7006199.1 hypothetical protein EDB82DRAFT_522159 [Fusarium venenatum]CEI64055.1 unnamed protein product [Fusarium venenatum]
MDGFSEFYVSCNPPLLPVGVSSVIADVTNDLGETILEVLYEPENSWFKFISAVQDQPAITCWMHKRLYQLLETEVGLINEGGDQDEDQDDANCLDPKVRPDIQVLTERPHVIPYPSLRYISADIIEQYDPFKYPDHIKHLPHKRTWQGPEGLERVTVSRILSKFQLLLPASLGPDGIKTLGELTNCRISHNLQGSLCYIGTDQGLSALDAATRKLNTFASLMNPPSATTSHLIYTEKQEPVRVCYVWTTHVGLSKMTYVDPECSNLDDEYKRIAGAVTLRIGVANNKGLPIPDSTTYPTAEPKAPGRKQTDFHPFEGYTYGNKRSGTTAVKDQKRPLQCFQTEQPGISKKQLAAAEARCAPNIVKEAIDKNSSAHSSRRKPKALKNTRAVQKGKDELKSLLQYRESVAIWLGDIEPDEPPEAPTEVDDDEEDVVPFPTSSPNHPQLIDFQDSSQSQEGPGQNLMDMFDGPINYTTLVPDRVALSGADTTQSPPVTDSEVVFGKQSDELKHFFNTMNQKAAPESSWADIASRKNAAAKEHNDMDFGQNVRVKVVPGMDTPEITMDNDGYVKVSFDAEKKLHDLIEVFQAVPGRVSIQAKFGRVCIKGIPPAEVYLNPSPNGPFEFIGAKAKWLNDNNPHVEFYPILTTIATEANLIPHITGGRVPWVLTEKRVYYEFVCTEEDGTHPPKQLVVNVDADTFTHECLPLPRETSQAFIHCVQHAWDVKLSVVHRDMAQVTKEFEKFAASLVQSLDIKTNEIGEIVIHVEPKDATKWCINRARVHHEAKYRNGAKGSSYLTTNMVRVVERFLNATQKLYRGQLVPVALPGSGRVGQWFEATISSVTAEHELQENVGLELGEKTSWSPDSLERHGTFRAICEPAIRMVRHMDAVGNSNANGHGVQTDQPFFDAVEDSRKRAKNYSYW